MKDFYDIWLLSRQFSFDPHILAMAIKVTLDKRGTKIPASIEAFDSSFSQSKQTQWTAFRKRLRLDHAPSNLADVVADIQNFLDPILCDIR